MDQMKFHRQKLFALVAAILGVISCLLPWWSLGFFGTAFSVNGLHDFGVLVFLAFIAVIVITTAMGDKSATYDEKNRLYVSIAFGAAALFTLIQYLRQTQFTTYGIWLSLLSAIAGGLIVYVLKPQQFEKGV